MEKTDKPFLLKDNETGAVINNNRSALEAAKNKKKEQKLIQLLVEKINNLEERIKLLETGNDRSKQRLASSKGNRKTTI